MTYRKPTLDFCCLFDFPRLSGELLALIDEFGPYMDRRETWLMTCKRAVEQGATTIIETGCYRGNPMDGGSTLILAQLAKDNGGYLHSYELNPQSIVQAQNALAGRGLLEYVRFHPGDSVINLASENDLIDFAYLDSYDCGYGPDYSACQRHCLAELEAVIPRLSRRALVALDDLLPNGGGKPPMAMRRLESLEWLKLAEGYQAVYCTENSRRLVPHRFAVLCGHMRDYAPLAARTLYRNRAQYCLRHGYDLRLFRDPGRFADKNSYTLGFSWARFAELVRLLQSGAYEWVWTVGADTLVTNMAVSLESLVADAETPEAQAALPPPWPAPPPYVKPPPPVIQWQGGSGKVPSRKHVIIAGEAVAAVQADSYLIRCSPEGIAYARDILAQYPAYKDHAWAENQTMIDLRDKHGAITHIMPQHRMNAFDYSLFHHCGEIYQRGKDCYGNRGQWQQGDFLLHWPGVPLAKRMELLGKYEPQIMQ